MSSSIIFGGASLGEGAFSTDESMVAVYDTLVAAKISRIDTARRYPKMAPGCSEQLLGSTRAINHGFAIDTKINVTSVSQSGGSLSKDKIKESIAASLTALRHSQINVLYCHAPDPVTPPEETAAELHRQLTQGIIKEIGLSNYSYQQVQEFLETCETHGWTKPTVYQGQYNAVCRNTEDELLPLLRQHGISFVAFSPLAGGFLTGKLSLGQDLAGSRYADGNPMGASYRPMYDKKAMHTAVKELYFRLQQHGIELAEASLRWVYHHSVLQEGDGIILGASDIAQIEENMRWINKGRLEKNIVTLFEDMWEKVKDVAP